MIQNEPDCKILYSQSIKEVIALAKEIPELNIGGSFMSKNEIKSCMDNPKGVFLGMYLNYKLIGFAYGFAETCDSACLMYICISKEHRGKGYGKSLFNHFHASILHFGIKKIYALTTTNLSGDFFKVMGFTHRQVLSYWDKNTNTQEHQSGISERESTSIKILPSIWKKAKSGEQPKTHGVEHE